MATCNDTVIRLDERREDVASSRHPDAAESVEPVLLSGVIRVLEDALSRAKRGDSAGVTVIEYSRDGAWNTTSAGTVLRSPALGVVAAQMLSSQFVRRLEDAAATSPRPDRRC